MSTEMRQIRLEKLLPHPDNPNVMSKANLARLVRHIERTGRYEPLVVRPHPQVAGAFQIVNGHHRCEALRRLGHETADVVVWDVDDEQTAILLTTLNRLGGRDVLEKKLALLRRLNKNLSVPSLSKLLPESRSQLERLIARKPHARPSSQSPDPVAAPLVFFVTEPQQYRIEEALSLAATPDEKAPRAARRAAALTCLAQSFLRSTQQETAR